MRSLRAKRVCEGVLRIEITYGVTVDEEFLRAHPNEQKEIIRRDLLQAANDVISDTDFAQIKIVKEEAE